MWTLEDEQALREDLIEKVIANANEGDGKLSRNELGNFEYAGQHIRVIDVQGGIWNPGASWPLGDALRATLSINTTNSDQANEELVSPPAIRVQSGIDFVVTLNGSNDLVPQALTMTVIRPGDNRRVDL